MREIRLIVHDIRSTHNVGSLMRTAEGMGISCIYFSGYTPYPRSVEDKRLPHIVEKLDKQIHKTALGAEKLVSWAIIENIAICIDELRAEGFEMVALEQAPHSIPLANYNPSEKIAILIGREVEGIDEALLKKCDIVIEIPMFGKKESFNVVQAAAMALYHCRFS